MLYSAPPFQTFLGEIFGIVHATYEEVTHSLTRTHTLNAAGNNLPNSIYWIVVSFAD